MESNIKGLVAAGHEMASELKAECGAVDMRSVAKLISDLATQLEVQLVRANALAALEVEPIGFRCRRNDNLGDWSYVYHREPDDFERKHLVIEGIYAAPPAPVPLTEVQRAMLRDMDVEISAELEEEEEIYRDGIRKCIAALRYHHKRAETCSNGYTGSTLEEDTLKSINFLKRNN
ncbi:TPA: hypothetical protein ACQ7ZM_002737, partial [Escherichia coli]